MDIFETILLKLLELFAGKVPVGVAVFLFLVVLAIVKYKSLVEIYKNFKASSNQKNKIQEKIARNLAKTSSTLEKFSNNVNQNTQMLKNTLDTGFAEIMSEFNNLPSKDFLQAELEGVKDFLQTEAEGIKKKISEMQATINTFVESQSKKN